MNQGPSPAGEQTASPSCGYVPAMTATSRMLGQLTIAWF